MSLLKLFNFSMAPQIILLQIVTTPPSLSHHPLSVCRCAQSLSRVWFFGNPMDCNLPGSSVPGMFQVRILDWVAFSYSKDLPYPRIKTASLAYPTLAERSFTTGIPRKPPSSYSTVFFILLHLVSSGKLYKLLIYSLLLMLCLYLVHPSISNHLEPCFTHGRKSNIWLINIEWKTSWFLVHLKLAQHCKSTILQ